MKLSFHNSSLLFIIVFSITLQNICYPQEEVLNSNSCDTSKTVKSDSLKSVFKSNSALWQADAAETDGLIAEDFGDYVQVLPSVLPLDLGSLGQFSPLTFRGATAQEGKVLLDGLIFEDPILGSLNSNSIPINFLDAFSFGGAGAFAPLGEQGLGGVLQVNAYQFQASKPYSKVIFRAGDWGYSDIGITFGLPLTKSSSFLISGNRQELDGFVLNGGHAGSRVDIKLSYHPQENLLLNYSVLLNRDKVEVPAPLLPDLVPGTSNAQRKENRSNQVLFARLGDLRENNKQLLGRVFISQLLQQSFGDSLLFKNSNLALGAGVQFDLISGIHWLSLGGDLRIYDLNSLQLKDQWDQLGHIFVRDNIQFAKSWALGFQGRLEKHDDYSMVFNSSGHLNYDLTPESSIWIGVQTARRYPNFAERYWPTQFFQGDPSLAEEKGTAFEIGFRVHKENNFKFETALFRHRAEDWIGQTLLADSAAFGPSNRGSRTIHGLDLKFVWNYTPRGQFGLIGSFLGLEENAPEKQLQVPEYFIYSYLQMGGSFFQDFVFVTLRVIGRFFGERTGRVYGEGATLPATITLGQTAVLDGKMTFHFTDASIFLSIENLLDKKYQLVPGFFMPPKTFRFGIAWEFWN